MRAGFHIGRSHRVEPSLNRIHGPGGTTQVEPKVMEVLQALADAPGQVISKEQLIVRVWSDTNVTDDVLTRTISELRRVFRDDAKRPAFIETIPKRGYRLIAPVQPFDSATGAGDAADSSGPPQATVSPATESSPPVDRAVRRRRTLLVAAVVSAAIVGTVSVAVFVRSHRMAARRPARVVTLPLNGLPGEQDDPAISPDGRFVAYSSSGSEPGARNIYVQQIGTGPPLRLTTTRNADLRPTWSPDGRLIAFIRSTNDVKPGDWSEIGIFVIAPLGGPERRILPPFLGALYYHGSLSWSPDGVALAFSDTDGHGDPYRIVVLTLATGEKRSWTNPPKHVLGDGRAAFSPDGKAIAFTRQASEWAMDVYLTRGERTPLERLTSDNRVVQGLTWTTDGRIVFASNRGGIVGLWAIPAEGGEPVAEIIGGEETRDPTASRTLERLAYVRAVFHCNIWTARRHPDGTWGPPHRLTESLQPEYAPAFAPDGRRLAFTSSQTGNSEVWVIGSDGSKPLALTSYRGPLVGMPRWSPDGGQLVFEARLSGDSDLMLTDVDASQTRPLVTGKNDDKVPSWSADGRFVYFVSNRSGAMDWQLWKTPAGGGEPTRVTVHGGFNAAESRDGRFLYYAKFFEPGLWRMAVTGGPEVCVLPDLPPVCWGQWALADEGVYFVNTGGPDAAIQYLDFRTGTRTRVGTMTGRPVLGNPGLALSRDGSSLAFVQIEEWNQSIMVVDNYR